MDNIFYYLEECFEDEREICAVTYDEHFENFFDLMKAGELCFNINKNEVLIKRKENELHFHNFLKHQMFSHLQEIKYYSDVNILDTRRLVAVSQDCISMIQILVRDKIELMVHFRSSDFDGALPADLEFICTLPYELIRHLSKMKGIKGYEEVTDKMLTELGKMPVHLTLSFGSLHRTN